MILKNPPSKSIEGYEKRFKKYPKIKKAFETSYKKVGYSMKVPLNFKTQKEFLTKAGFNIDKCLSSRGRVKLGGGKGVNTCIQGVIDKELALARKSGNVAKFSKFGKLASKAGWVVGWVDIPIELAFALPHLLAGNVQDAKAATTFGLLRLWRKKN